VTRIPNLFLAGDYVRTNTDLATMEGANEAARRAVNGILAADRSRQPLCKVWQLSEPPFFAPFKWLDRRRFAVGQAWSGRVPWAMRIFLAPWSLVFAVILAIKSLLNVIAPTRRDK
jgi:hypothetical protein